MDWEKQARVWVGVDCGRVLELGCLHRGGYERRMSRRLSPSRRESTRVWIITESEFCSFDRTSKRLFTDVYMFLVLHIYN